MKAFRKGLLLALLHVLIVLSLGGKLLYDRAHRPRLWVQTGSFDPDLPIRGRYFTLNLEVHDPEAALAWKGKPQIWQPVELTVENNQLIAHSTDKPSGLTIASWHWMPSHEGTDLFFLSPGVTFFIPEHAATPRLRPGDELWAEVTVPKKGLPRPIQLAIKHGSEWRPLNYR